ncbi:MAG: class I mannose-6-phosphate isomerase [Planctomycetota bacterium]|nr:class I mannose-6-phosphate isomerase [Planctomycetota bacterium]
MTRPFLVRPIYAKKPWGGRRMADELGRTDLPDGPVGESWEVVDTEAAASVVDGGPDDGRPLREVWGGPFPLLLKVLDAAEALSVQLHPDGQEGHPVKEEAWVALGSGGSVAVGSVGPDVAPDAILGALDELPLKAGAADGSAPPTVVHVPPGTVHAILAGSLLFEVQNPCDVTWRLYDHGRVGLDGQPRELHREAAAPLLARGAPAPVALDAAGRLAGDRFALELVPPGVATTSPDACAAFFTASGRVETPEATLDVPRGRTAVLPPGPRTLTSGGWIVLCSS